MLLNCDVLFSNCLRRLFSLGADVNPSLSTCLSESVPVCIGKEPREDPQDARTNLVNSITHHTGPLVRSNLPLLLHPDPTEMNRNSDKCDG